MNPDCNWNDLFWVKSTSNFLQCTRTLKKRFPCLIFGARIRDLIQNMARPWASPVSLGTRVRAVSAINIVYYVNYNCLHKQLALLCIRGNYQYSDTTIIGRSYTETNPRRYNCFSAFIRAYYRKLTFWSTWIEDNRISRTTQRMKIRLAPLRW